MKKLLFVLMALGLISFTACTQQKPAAEKVADDAAMAADKVEDAAKDAADKVEDAAEEAADEVQEAM